MPTQAEINAGLERLTRMVRAKLGTPLPEPAKTLVQDCWAVTIAYTALLEAVREHHAQKADDRCWLDTLKVYEAAGLPPPDNSVGDPEAMLLNCRRFVANECKGGGGWRSYAELDAENERLRARVTEIEKEYWLVKRPKEGEGFVSFPNAGAAPNHMLTPVVTIGHQPTVQNSSKEIQ